MSCLANVAVPRIVDPILKCVAYLVIFRIAELVTCRNTSISWRRMKSISILTRVCADMPSMFILAIFVISRTCGGGEAW